jgi:hypothetical protein
MVGIALALSLQVTSARADESDQTQASEANPSGSHPDKVLVQNTVVACANPVGLADLGQVGYRHRLYRSTAPAIANNFIGIGVVPMVSPAFARVGPILEVQPASVVSLSASYEEIRYFGTFGSLQSFTSPLSTYDEAELTRRSQLPSGAPHAPHATRGSQLNLSGTLQAKVGPFAARGVVRFMRPDYDVPSGDRVVYDSRYDLLVPNRGWFMSQDVDAVYMTDWGLVTGLRWTSTFAFYTAKDYAPGEAPTDPNTPMHRLGPVARYSIWKGRGGVFDDPTVFVMSAWWLSHRYVAGEERSRAVPFVAFGFEFTGDLLPELARSRRSLNAMSSGGRSN